MFAQGKMDRTMRRVIHGIAIGVIAAGSEPARGASVATVSPTMSLPDKNVQSPAPAHFGEYEFQYLVTAGDERTVSADAQAVPSMAVQFVPLPPALALGAAGLLGAALITRRRKRANRARSFG